MGAVSQRASQARKVQVGSVGGGGGGRKGCRVSSTSHIHSLARPATKRTNSPGLDIMRPRFTLILVISAEVKFTQPDTLDIAVLYPLNPYLHCKT